MKVTENIDNDTVNIIDIPRSFLLSFHGPLLENVVKKLSSEIIEKNGEEIKKSVDRDKIVEEIKMLVIERIANSIS